MFPEQPIMQAQKDMDKIYDWIDNGHLRAEKWLKVINQFKTSQTNNVISVINRDQQIQIIYPIQVQLYQDLMQFADEILQAATQIVNQSQVTIRDKYDGYIGPMKCSSVNLQLLSLLENYKPLRIDLLQLKNLLFFNNKPLVINIPKIMTQNIELLTALSVCSASVCGFQYMICNQEIKSSEIAQMCWIIQNSYRPFTIINPEELQQTSQFWLLNCYPKRQETDLQKDEIYQGYQQIKDEVNDGQCINVSGQLIIITRREQHDCQCHCCCKNIFCDKEQVIEVKQNYQQISLMDLILKDSMHVDLDCSLGVCRFGCDTEEEYVQGIQNINKQTMNLIQMLLKLSRLQFHLIQVRNPTEQLLADQAIIDGDCSMQSTENIDVSGFYLTLHDANDYTTCLFYDQKIKTPLELFYYTYINNNLINQHLRIAIINDLYTFFMDRKIISPSTQINEIPIPLDLQMPLITLLITTNPSLCYEMNNLLELLKNPMQVIEMKNQQTEQIMKKLQELIPFKDNTELDKFINICQISAYYYLNFFITQGINIFLKVKQTKTSKIMTQMLQELCQSIKQQDFSIVKYSVSLANLYKFFDKSLITKDNCNIEGKLGKQFIYSLKNLDVFNWVFNKQQIDNFDICKVFNIKFEDQLQQIQIKKLVYQTVTKGIYKLLANNISTKMSSQKQPCIYNITEKRMYQLKQTSTATEILTTACAQISEQYWCYCQPENLYFINTIDQCILNSQEFLEQTQQLQNCFYIFLPDIVSLIDNNQHQQQTRLNELQSQIMSLTNQVQNWYNQNEYQEIIVFQQNILQNQKIQLKQIDCQELIQTIEKIFTMYSSVQTYCSQQICDLLKQQFNDVINEKQVKFIIKMTVIYIQCASAFILVGLSQQKKEEMIAEIQDSYFELINYIFNNPHQQLVNVTNSIILTHIFQQDQLKLIFDQKALDFIEIEQLQMLQYNEFTTAILASVLTIWLGYVPIWQTLEEIDFFTLLFICKIKKFVKPDISIENKQQSIEHQIYYGELFQDYQYLLPKNPSQQQVSFGCLQTNYVLSPEQFKLVSKQLDDNEILMQKINFEEIQKTLLQENYDLFKNQPICLNLISNKFLNNNKIITANDLHYIQQDQGEEFVDKITYITQHTSANITVADYYQILGIIWKGQQKIQISSRYQSLIQQVKVQTILQLVKQYKQKRQKNVTWSDIIDDIMNGSQDKDSVTKILLMLLNTDINHINIYKQYDIKDTEQQIQVLSQEEVQQALVTMIDELLNEKFVSYQNIIKIINYDQSFRQQQLTNQYSKIILGNKIKFLVFKQPKNITLNQLQEDMLLQLQQQDQWFLAEKLQQIEGQDNIIFTIQKDTIQYDDFLNLILQANITKYKKIVVVLFTDNVHLTLEQKLNLIQQCDIYNINQTEINLSKIKEKQQQEQIIFWQDTDYKQWRILQITTQNIFAEDQQQKYKYSKLNSSLNQSNINQLQKDNLVQKIQELNINSNNLEEELTKLFTIPFINFYQQVITQSSQLELQSFDKAVEQYSGTQYLLNNDKYNLQQILQLNKEQSQQLTYKWLQYSYFLVYYPEYQQQLPQVQGHIHKWLTAYYNNIQRQTAEQQKKKVISQTKQIVQIQDTLQAPHLFPDTTMAMSLSLILSQLQNTSSLWNDLQQSLQQQYQPSDDQFFKVFLFIYANIGKISQSSILAQYVTQSQDPQFEKQKFYMFTEMFINLLAQQINRQKQQQLQPNQINQIEYLCFYFTNIKLCNLIAQTIHNLYKSDLQHYVVKYLQEQAQQSTSEQFYQNLQTKLLQFASDCFEKNLSYCVFFIRFALMNCSEQQIKQEKTKYWLSLTYYYLYYQNSQEIQLKQVCQAQKDSRLIGMFKNLINQPISSVILDILAKPQIQQNKYVVQQVLKHYFLMDGFSDNEEDAVKELIFCFEQYNIDHQLIVQLFQQKHNRIEIIDVESMLNVQIIKQLKINSMNLVNSILQLYKQKLDDQFENVIKQADQQEQLQFIKTQLTLRTKKWQFNYDLQQLNQYQPRGSEYINDIAIIKQCNAFTEQLIGYYLAKLFSETKFDFLQLKPLIKLNDQIQYQFYSALQSLYSRDIVNTMIQRNQVIQQVFPQIYSTAKQASLNAECDKLPQFSICHLLNSKLYYEQRVNRQWTDLTQISQLMQEYIINGDKQEVPDPIKKKLQQQNNQIFNHKNLQRIQIIKEVQQNENIQQLIKSTLIATEQLLIESGSGSNFYQLLADNHDECLGLYCPGHGFESRLGIVHFDCGTKDSKYAKMSPLEVQVRGLSSIATRLTWILSYACIYLSLKSNPITMTTSKEKSIMSEPDLLEMPRDDYCFVVIENCFSVITQILCCYQYEALILYQQFVVNLIKLIKENSKKTNIYMLKSAQQRDKLEDMIQQAVDQSMTSSQDILKKNQQSNQIQVNQVAVQQVQHKQLTHQQLVTKFIKAKIPIDIQTRLANGVFNGIVISKMLHYHINKLQPTMTIQEAISVCEEISKIKEKFYVFVDDYNMSKHLLTIGNGCQDNTLPDISKEACIGQLITFKADEVGQNSQDFAVMDQYIQAGRQYLQTLQLPYLPLYDELESRQITQQSWLFV